MPAVTKILVATDRSAAADTAVQWAADLAARYEAQLLILQVIAPESLVGEGEATAAAAQPRLAELAARVAGERGQGRVAFDSDPVEAVLRTVAQEGVDLIVISNAGMSNRSEFLFGNVPNRISHSARCSIVLVGTATGGGAPDEVPPQTEPAPGQLLGRTATIGRILLRHGLREIRPGRARRSAQERARNFREALETLGPTFSKLGQILSTRPDLLPPEFIDELAKLQDRVPPLSEAQVVALMEAEFKVPWEDVFEQIEPEPMAAGTIAQVHRAVLASGERVVAKVQRPGADAAILRDLGLLELFAQKAAERPALREVADLPAVIQHLAGSLRRELDFTIEAANIEHMRTILEPYSRLAVPRVYHEISTTRLLVMEEVQGVPVLEAPEGPARSEAAQQLLESYMQQVLGDGFFHADPHPGNLLWWNDTIYLLDFGMVGELDAGVREQLLLALLAFAQEDAEFLTDVLIALSGQTATSGLDVVGLRTDLAQLIADYRHLTIEQLRLGPLIQRMTQIAARHRLRLPASLALAAKAFGQMQLIAATLDPSLDPFDVATSFFRRRLIAEARRLVSPRQLAFEAQKLRLRLTRLVEGIERLTSAGSGSGLRVEFTGIDRLERGIRRSGQLVALALVAATAGLLAMGLAVTLGSVARGPVLALGALGVLVLAALAAILVSP